MNIPVTSRVHRILACMEQYSNFKDCSKNPKDYPIELEDGENPLGVYENVLDQIEESIVITDQAIYYCDGVNHSEKAKYQSILNTETPKDKLTDDVLRVVLKDGRRFLLPIRRAYEGARTSNLFGFIRFINRVKADLESNNDT